MKIRYDAFILKQLAVVAIAVHTMDEIDQQLLYGLILYVNQYAKL